MPAVRRVHDKIRRLPHTCIFPIGVEPQHHIPLSLQRILRVPPLEKGALFVMVTLFAGSSGSSTSTTHLWKTPLSMLHQRQ